MEPMPPERLEEIKELCNGTTEPKMWCAQIAIDSFNGFDFPYGPMSANIEETRANFYFLKESRGIVSELIAEVERLKEELRQKDIAIRVRKAMEEE